MTEKRQVRGLLDVIAAELGGAEWGCTEPPLGLGFGATSDAQRWAEIGYLTDRLADLNAQIGNRNRRKGRPSKGRYETIDAERAFRLWSIAHDIAAHGLGPIPDVGPTSAYAPDRTMSARYRLFA